MIVSEREMLSANVKELFTAYTIGQVVDCIVSGVADFGVFVRFADNPQIEGMIHISELDYKLIDNPKELVKVNDPLKAKIIDIKEGRVFLSLKALKEDPWVKLGDDFKPGEAVKAKSISSIRSARWLRSMATSKAWCTSPNSAARKR